MLVMVLFEYIFIFDLTRTGECTKILIKVDIKLNFPD